MSEQNKKIKNQSGEVMLEASLVMFLVIVMLFALLSISFMFYQQATMTNLASELSAEIARTYKYGEALDIGDYDLDKNIIINTKKYRTTFQRGSIISQAQEKATPFAEQRLASTGMGLSPDEVNVECNIKCSGIGRNYVEVKVSQNTDFFLSGILEFCGIIDDSSQLFGATAYAECSDMTGYHSITNFTRELSEALKEFDPIGSAYGSMRELYEAIETFWNEYS